MKGGYPATVKVGCCGFPGGLARYCQEWAVAEVQQTFYKPPQVATAQRWRQQAPPEFEFTLKAWQLITHPPSSPTYRRAGLNIPPQRHGEYGFFRPTGAVMAAYQATLEIARALGARLILFQCPASFTPSEENLRNMKRFFSGISREHLLVWEPRGTWPEATVLGLCRDLGLIPAGDPLAGNPLYGDIFYFRLHGGPGYRHSYSDEELRALQALARGQGYVLFNNLAMARDGRRFRELLAGSPGPGV